MTREELRQIFYLNQEIQMWQKELNRLQCESLVKSQRITGMPFQSGITDSVGEIVTDMADIEAIIKGKLAEIQVQRKTILEYISGIDDSFMRQILFYRHVSCMSWNQVAANIGGGNTEGSVKMAYKRFLNK